MYDGWNLIQETTTTDSGESTEYYVWGLDLSGSLQGAGGIGGLLMRQMDSGEFLYLYDANGNVGQLVDASTGSLAAQYEYDPFGNTIVANGSEAGSNPFRFSTKYFDEETGLSYYGYRYYSPELGRWINRDPIKEDGGLNLYGFVGNGPINKFDLLGLATVINNSEMTLVLIASHTYKWKCLGEDEKGCCDAKDEHKESALPFGLSNEGSQAKPGKPFDDVDAIIDVDGAPYKTGGFRKVVVTGGPPPTLLDFDPGFIGIGSVGKKSPDAFWGDPTILARCDAAINTLYYKDKMEECREENADVISRITNHIQLIEQAKGILQNVYGFTS